MDPLWKLCDDGNLKGVRLALARGEDLNYESDSGLTLLMYAAWKRHTAAYNGHNSIVKLLLDQAGVKINKQDNSGDTALHCAAWSNNREGARMLLLHPTMDSANAKNNNGYTAVMAAVMGGHKEVLSELVAHQSVSLDYR